MNCFLVSRNQEIWQFVVSDSPLLPGSQRQNVREKVSRNPVLLPTLLALNGHLKRCPPLPLLSLFVWLAGLLCLRTMCSCMPQCSCGAQSRHHCLSPCVLWGRNQAGQEPPEQHLGPGWKGLVGWCLYRWVLEHVFQKKMTSHRFAANPSSV